MSYSHYKNRGKRAQLTASAKRRRERACGIGRVGPPAICLNGAVSWPLLWEMVYHELRERDYSTGTLKIYRHVLRSFSKWFFSTPDRVTTKSVEAYIWKLTDEHCSWTWTSTTISVLRTVFDGMCGLGVSLSLPTPKRPHHLPHFLNSDEAWSLLSACSTPRDQLLLGLMYGCGLKVGEACALRWEDIDCEAGTVTVWYDRGKRTREVPFPENLLEVLKKGVESCAPIAHVFCGSREGMPLSTRMAGMILQQAASHAKILKPICGMTLRHSYAVQRLIDGASIREVQECLGHRDIYTTMIYERCIPTPLRHGAPADACLEPPGLRNLPPISEDANGGASKAPQIPVRTLKVPEVQLPPELPFPPVRISLIERTRLFCHALKTHIGARFLARRHSAQAPPG